MADSGIIICQQADDYIIQNPLLQPQTLIEKDVDALGPVLKGYFRESITKRRKTGEENEKLPLCSDDLLCAKSQSSSPGN